MKRSSTGGLQGADLILKAESPKALDRSVFQTADGQLLRDGPHHLHPHGGLGLLPLLAPVPAAQGDVLLQVRHGRDGQHDLQLGERPGQDMFDF